MFSLNALFLALLLAFHSVVRADDSFYNPLFKAKVDKIIQKFHSKKMTIPEFKRIMIEKKNVLVIDTREEEEFRVSHIQGAINVGYKNFSVDDFVAKYPKDQTVIAYCSVGYRSGEISDILMDKGYDVFNLMGGIFEWINQGNDVYTENSKKTMKVHTYNKSWGQWITTQYEKIY